MLFLPACHSSQLGPVWVGSGRLGPVNHSLIQSFILAMKEGIEGWLPYFGCILSAVVAFQAWNVNMALMTLILGNPGWLQATLLGVEVVDDGLCNFWTGFIGFGPGFQ